MPFPKFPKLWGKLKFELPILKSFTKVLTIDPEGIWEKKSMEIHLITPRTFPSKPQNIMDQSHVEFMDVFELKLMPIHPLGVEKFPWNGDKSDLLVELKENSGTHQSHQHSTSGEDEHM